MTSIMARHTWRSAAMSRLRSCRIASNRKVAGALPQAAVQAAKREQGFGHEGAEVGQCGFAFQKWWKINSLRI